MDDVIAEIATRTGLDASVVRKAVGIIVGFLSREAPAEKAQPLLAKLPGAQQLADANGTISGGLFGIFTALSGAGLGMGEIQTIAREFIKVAKAKAGDKEVDALLATIPGISQFI
jgi:hypothetical protein